MKNISTRIFYKKVNKKEYRSAVRNFTFSFEKSKLDWYIPRFSDPFKNDTDSEISFISDPFNQDVSGTILKIYSGNMNDKMNKALKGNLSIILDKSKITLEELHKNSTDITKKIFLSENKLSETDLIEQYCKRLDIRTYGVQYVAIKKSKNNIEDPFFIYSAYIPIGPSLCYILAAGEKGKGFKSIITNLETISSSINLDLFVQGLKSENYNLDLIAKHA